MNKYQKNVFKMARTENLVFVDYEEDWITDQAMADVITVFRRLLLNIGENVKNQEIDISGITQNKLDMKDSFIDNTIDVQSRIASLASAIGDKSLYNQVDKSASELSDLGDISLFEHGQLLIDIAAERKDALQPYGIDDKMMEEYGKEAKAYIDYSQEPRKAIAARKTATANLATLIPELSYYMSYTVDTNMIRFHKTNPEFYAAYTSARNIVDGPVHKYAALGSVIDEETHAFLQNVKVSFMLKSETGAVTIVRTVTTTKSGTFKVKTLEPGLYKIVFELFSYDSLTLELVVYKNQQLRLNVAIRKTE